MNNLGDLLKKAGFQATDKPDEPEAPIASEPETAELVFAAKVVLRKTKKGRGGKTVTLIEGVQSGQDELAKTLRKQLGTGTSVEEGVIVVQGDQRGRLGGVLKKLGAKKVVQ